MTPPPISKRTMRTPSGEVRSWYRLRPRRPRNRASGGPTRERRTATAKDDDVPSAETRTTWYWSAGRAPRGRPGRPRVPAVPVARARASSPTSLAEPSSTASTTRPPTTSPIRTASSWDVPPTAARRPSSSGSPGGRRRRSRGSTHRPRHHAAGAWRRPDPPTARHWAGSPSPTTTEGPAPARSTVRTVAGAPNRPERTQHVPRRRDGDVGLGPGASRVDRSGWASRRRTPRAAVADRRPRDRCAPTRRRRTTTGPAGSASNPGARPARRGPVPHGRMQHGLAAPWTERPNGTREELAARQVPRHVEARRSGRGQAPTAGR